MNHKDFITCQNTHHIQTESVKFKLIKMYKMSVKKIKIITQQKGIYFVYKTKSE